MKAKQRETYRTRILQLLRERSPGKTICPSEVLEAEDKHNKLMMEEVRSVAKELAADGVIEICQSGKAIDPETFKGPIRLRLK